MNSSVSHIAGIWTVTQHMQGVGATKQILSDYQWHT